MVARARSERRWTSAPRLRGFEFVVVALVALTAATQTLADNGGGPSWNMIGNDSANSRNNPFESQISTANVSQLAPKWSLPSAVPGAPPNQFATTTGDVSGDPGGRRRGGVLRRLRRHAVEARRRHRRGDLVAPGLGLHRDRRRPRAHEPVARRQHADRRQPAAPSCSGSTRRPATLLWKTQVHPDTQRRHGS